MQRSPLTLDHLGQASGMGEYLPAIPEMPQKSGNGISMDAVVATLEDEMVQLSDQLARTFEELSLIHDLSRNTQIATDRKTHCHEALRRLSDCLQANTLAVFLPQEITASVGKTGWLPSQYSSVNEEYEQQLAVGLKALSPAPIVQHGHPIDDDLLRRIVSELDDSRQIVANYPLRCAPQIDRSAVVSLEEGTAGCGRILIVGARPMPELGTIEVQLMQSVGMILNAQLAIHRQFDAMRRMFEGTVRALVSAIDAKDPYTCGHSSRVSALAESLAVDYGLPLDEIETVRMSGLLHDIGKIGVSDAVLRKPGRLTQEEFEEIKKHPELGYRILRGVPQFNDILPGVRYHHEAWNGKGYPFGLAGTDIPLIARIMAVADAFDAMTSTRPYRNGMPLNRVIDTFIEGCGVQWDPDIVAILLENEERMERMVDEGHP